MSSSISKQSHHEQQELCSTRPSYRQGRKLTAVKVYTVNDESTHLLVSRVPAIQLHAELSALCSRFGTITCCVLVPDYDNDESFVETYHVQYSRLQSARNLEGSQSWQQLKRKGILDHKNDLQEQKLSNLSNGTGNLQQLTVFAKRQLDGRSFFGGVLHVCYAPELETVNETRAKLVLRRKEVASRVKKRMKTNEKNAVVTSRSNFLNNTAGFSESVQSQAVCNTPRLPVAFPVQSLGSTVASVSQQIPFPVAVEEGTTNNVPCKPETLTDHQSGPNLSINPPSHNPLRFIPRQVVVSKRIIFHKKS